MLHQSFMLYPALNENSIFLEEQTQEVGLVPGNQVVGSLQEEILAALFEIVSSCYNFETREWSSYLLCQQMGVALQSLQMRGVHRYLPQVPECNISNIS